MPVKGALIVCCSRILAASSASLASTVLLLGFEAKCVGILELCAGLVEFLAGHDTRIVSIQHSQTCEGDSGLFKLCGGLFDGTCAVGDEGRFLAVETGDLGAELTDLLVLDDAGTDLFFEPLDDAFLRGGELGVFHPVEGSRTTMALDGARRRPARRRGADLERATRTAEHDREGHGGCNGDRAISLSCSWRSPQVSIDQAGVSIGSGGSSLVNERPAERDVLVPEVDDVAHQGIGHVASPQLMRHELRHRAAGPGFARRTGDERRR